MNYWTQLVIVVFAAVGLAFAMQIFRYATGYDPSFGIATGLFGLTIFRSMNNE